MEIKDDSKNNIGVSTMWFTVNQDDKTLSVIRLSSHKLPLKHYFKTIPPPIVINNKRNVV